MKENSNRLEKVENYFIGSLLLISFVGLSAGFFWFGFFGTYTPGT